MEYCSAQRLFCPVLPICRGDAAAASFQPFGPRGYGVSCHEALQQDEAAGPAHLRPAVQLPGTKKSEQRKSIRRREPLAVSRSCCSVAQMGRACAYIHAVGWGALSPESPFAVSISCFATWGSQRMGGVDPWQSSRF